MKSLAIFFVLAVALVTGCARKRETLSVYHESSRVAARIAAELEAKANGGRVYEIAPTGSMEPTLHGGDYATAVPTRFENLAVGMIVNYRPDWNEKRLTCHRLAATWPNGMFVAEGDGPKNGAETSSQVDAANYVDHVVSVYRFP